MMKTPAWLQKYERPLQQIAPGAPIAGRPMAPSPAGRPIAGPGLMLPGMKHSRFTGAGADNVIQKSKPVERDFYENHEGETVINAKDTNRNGGPIGVAKKLGISPEKMMRGGEVRNVDMPIQGFRRGGRVRAKIHGYAETGSVSSLDRLKNIGSGVADVFDPYADVVKDIFTNDTPMGTGDNLPIQNDPSKQQPFLGKINDVTYTDKASYDAAYKAAGGTGRGGSESAGYSTQYPKTITRTNGDGTSATATVQNLAEEQSFMSRASATGGSASVGPRVVSAPFLGKINGVTYTDKASYDVAYKVAGGTGRGGSESAGYSTQYPKTITRMNGDGTSATATVQNLAEEQSFMSRASATGGSASAGRIIQSSNTSNAGAESEEVDGQAEVDYWTNNAGDYERLNRDIANGTSPVFQRMSDMAFNTLNPQLQVSLTLTAMQIAQDPSLTKGMAQTMMAQAIRNVGVQQSNLAAEMAQKSMDLAYDAIGKGFTMSTNQQSFFETVRQNKGKEAWTAFEYAAQYGSDADVISAYKTATGKDLDPASVAEIRGYARSKRTQDLITGELSIQSARNTLGDQKFASVKQRIDSGAELADVQTEFPDVTPEIYASIRANGTIGDRVYARNTTAIYTLLASPTPANLAQAAALIETTYGINFDYSSILSSENAGKFGDGMTRLSEIVATPGTSWTVARKALMDGGFLNILGGEDAAKTLYDNMVYKSSPIGRLLDSYQDTDILLGYPHPKGDSATDAEKADWANKFRRVIAKVKLQGGYVVNETTGKLELADPEMLTTLLKEEGIIPKDKEDGGEAWVPHETIPGLNADGDTFKKKDGTTIPVVNLYGTGTTLGAADMAVKNPTTGQWFRPKENDTVYFEVAVDTYEGARIPPGAYTYKIIDGKEYWVNANNPDKIYRASSVTTAKSTIGTTVKAPVSIALRDTIESVLRNQDIDYIYTTAEGRKFKKTGATEWEEV